MARKLDVRVLAEGIKENLIKRSKAIATPKILAVYIGNDKASQIYLNQQRKVVNEIGIELNVVRALALDYNILNITTPFIIQQPIKLASGITKQSLSNWLNRYQQYDVDGICSNNIAAISSGTTPTFYPCTPSAIIELLETNGIQIEGKNIVVIGRSNTVGKPLAQMLGNKNATVTVCHSKTNPLILSRVCSYANIIISATGSPNTIVYPVVTPKPYQTYIDVGLSQDEFGNMVGDIDGQIFERCHSYCCSPGGVGPITVLKLMENVLLYYERNLK